MQKGWRKRADFYARLASVSSLDALEDWEKLKLEADAKQIGYPWPSGPADVAARVIKSRRLRHLPPLPAAEASEEQRTWTLRYILWEMIHNVQPYARKWIVGLLEDGKVDDLPDIPVGTVLMLANGAVKRAPKKKPDPGFPQVEAVLDLYWILQRDPFPFQRCSQCRSIFVPLRRQRYCTPSCARAVIRAARRESRREYMKRYMRQYTKRQRTADEPLSTKTVGRP